MIAGAVAQMLVTGGLAGVSIGRFGADYVKGGAAQYAVSDEGGADATVLGTASDPWYEARLQVRCRADDMIAAVEGLKTAFDLVRAAYGQTLVWTNPRGGTRSYQLIVVKTEMRPTWFPSPTPGEVATCNFKLRVRPA